MAEKKSCAWRMGGNATRTPAGGGRASTKGPPYPSLNLTERELFVSALAA